MGRSPATVNYPRLITALSITKSYISRRLSGKDLVMLNRSIDDDCRQMTLQSGF